MVVGYREAFAFAGAVSADQDVTRRDVLRSAARTVGSWMRSHETPVAGVDTEVMAWCSRRVILEFRLS